MMGTNQKEIKNFDSLLLVNLATPEGQEEDSRSSEKNAYSFDGIIDALKKDFNITQNNNTITVKDKQVAYRYLAKKQERQERAVSFSPLPIGVDLAILINGNDNENEGFRLKIMIKEEIQDSCSSDGSFSISMKNAENFNSKKECDEKIIEEIRKLINGGAKV